MSELCVAGPASVPLTRGLLAQGWTSAALLATCIPAGEFNHYPKLIRFPSSMKYMNSIGAYAFEGAKGVIIKDPWPELQFIGRNAFGVQNWTADGSAHSESDIEWTKDALPKLERIESEAFLGFSGKLSIDVNVPNLHMVQTRAFSGIGRPVCAIGSPVDCYVGPAVDAAIEWSGVVVQTEFPPVPPTTNFRLIRVHHIEHTTLRDNDETLWIDAKSLRPTGMRTLNCLELNAGDGNVLKFEGFTSLTSLGSQIFSDTNAAIKMKGVLSVSPALALAPDTFAGMPSELDLVDMAFEAASCAGFPQQTFGIPSVWCSLPTHQQDTTNAAQCIFGRCAPKFHCLTNYHTIYSGPPDASVRGYCIPAPALCEQANGGAGCAPTTEECVPTDTADCFSTAWNYPSSCYECRSTGSIDAVATTITATTTAAAITTTTIVADTTTRTSTTGPIPPSDVPPPITPTDHSWSSWLRLVVGCLSGLAGGVVVGIIIFWCRSRTCYSDERYIDDDYEIVLQPDTACSETESDSDLEDLELYPRRSHAATPFR